MTEDDLIALYSDDILQVSSADFAFKALLRWANVDDVARKAAFVRLASNIRFSLCSDELLSMDFTDNPLMKNDECLALIREAQTSNFDQSKSQPRATTGDCLVRVIERSEATKLEISSDGSSWKSCVSNLEIWRPGLHLVLQPSGMGLLH
jgi:hypothetical protein